MLGALAVTAVLPTGRDYLRIETLLSSYARRIVVRAHIHFESPEMIGRQLDLHFDFLQNRLH